MIYHFHLAIGARMWGYYIAPDGTTLLRTRGAYVPDREAVLRQSGGILNIPMVDRVVDQSLAISWQSVFGFLYGGAHPAEPGHNRSSSPGAALADDTEREAAKHRSRANPTFDQRHDSKLMHIRPNSRRRTLPKVFGLYNIRAEQCP